METTSKQSVIDNVQLKNLIQGLKEKQENQTDRDKLTLDLYQHAKTIEHDNNKF